MGVAKLASQRSKDPSTQVGACIVNSDNMIVSVGYNGLPAGCSDDDFPWAREGEVFDTKYAYVCHAELNAILNSNIPTLSGSTLYVTLFPCNECAKAIIQCGIKRVVYLDNKYADSDQVRASAMMFGKCGIKTEKYEITGRTLTINL